MVETAERTDIHPALAEALRANREAFNRRFVQRQRAGATIDPIAFQRHLRTTVNELIQKVAAVQPERIPAAVDALFDASLDLFAAGLLGPEPKHPHVAAAWTAVLPQAARLLARDPVRIVGSVSNAADYLANHAGARPTEWIELMSVLSPECGSVAEWLNAGKVAAWRAGVVRFRSEALRISHELPAKLAARCLGLPDDIAEGDVGSAINRLAADCWLHPSNSTPQQADRSLQIVRSVGEFRGFGGPCLRPPKVTLQSDGLVITDGDSDWRLFADVFGTFWQRIPHSSTKATRSTGVLIDARGRISWNGMTQQFDDLAESNSHACDGQTLAVTLPTSYHVFLVAQIVRESN